MIPVFLLNIKSKVALSDWSLFMAMGGTEEKEISRADKVSHKTKVG